MYKTLELPPREAKPRQRGLTMITDTGTPLAELDQILDSYHPFLDMAKLGIGTAYVEPRLDEKIARYDRYGIPVYFGGTLFEKFHSQKRLPDYLDFLRHHAITTIEISCGTIALEREAILELIQELKSEFQVLVEVGKKEAGPHYPREQWAADARDFLAAGCSHVILEGRNTADAGIYTPQGELDQSLVDTITDQAAPDRLIFEAPTQKSQGQIIRLLGANVNLGNVFIRDLLFLEAQRRGLREETFFIPCEP